MLIVLLAQPLSVCICMAMCVSASVYVVLEGSNGNNERKIC